MEGETDTERGRCGGQLIRLRIRTLAAVSLWPQTPLHLLLSVCVCVDNPLRGKRSAAGRERGDSPQRSRV